MENAKEKDIEISNISHIKQQKFEGRIKPFRGHRIFSYNTKTGEVKESEVEILINIEGKVSKKIIVDRNCIYKSFLNLENAKRKFPKIIKNAIRQ